MATVDAGVVIPTYNRAALLREALESVLAQTPPPLEIVVVDDGSTDDTPAVVEALSGRGVPLKYLREAHTGRRSALRNVGVRATSSRWIAFLDSDDVWTPNRLAAQFAAIEREPQAAWAFCNLRLSGEAVGEAAEPWHPHGVGYGGHMLGDLLEDSRVASSTLLVRRDAFEDVGGFPEVRTNEDFLLALNLAAKYAVAYAPEVLVLMREHGGRISRVAREHTLQDYLSIVARFVREHPALTREERAKARRGMANVHMKLARLYLDAGNRTAARGHLLRLAGLRPWDRRIPGAMLRALRPAPRGFTP